MNIEKLEDWLDGVKDNHCREIVELIINAVRDYPMLDLNDTTDYFNQVKHLLCSNTITSAILTDFLNSTSNTSNENFFWIKVSLNSLLEAFDLMNLYNINFNDIVDRIEKKSKI